MGSQVRTLQRAPFFASMPEAKNGKPMNQLKEAKNALGSS
jgi:hypothetical protein